MTFDRWKEGVLAALAIAAVAAAAAYALFFRDIGEVEDERQEFGVSFIIDFLSPDFPDPAYQAMMLGLLEEHYPDELQAFRDAARRGAVPYGTELHERLSAANARLAREAHGMHFVRNCGTCGKGVLGEVQPATAWRHEELRGPNGEVFARARLRDTSLAFLCGNCGWSSSRVLFSETSGVELSGEGS